MTNRACRRAQHISEVYKRVIKKCHFLERSDLSKKSLSALAFVLLFLPFDCDFAAVICMFYLFLRTNRISPFWKIFSVTQRTLKHFAWRDALSFFPSITFAFALAVFFEIRSRYQGRDILFTFFVTKAESDSKSDCKKRVRKGRNLCVSPKRQSASFQSFVTRCFSSPKKWNNRLTRWMKLLLLWADTHSRQRQQFFFDASVTFEQTRCIFAILQIISFAEKDYPEYN